MKHSWLIVLLAFLTTPLLAQQQTEAVSIADSLSADWSEIRFDTDVINRMAYADTANFMHQKVYPCARCLLRPEVAKALDKAHEIAVEKGVRLVIFDCYRPYPIQYKMYEIVNNPKYVAKPGKGSNHNRGQAIDISLADMDGNLLDMGGGFDDFSEVSHPGYKGISKQAKANRKLLAKIMTRAGFSIYPYEWWHFDYKQQRYETSEYIWECN